MKYVFLRICMCVYIYIYIYIYIQIQEHIDAHRQSHFIGSERM